MRLSKAFTRITKRKPKKKYIYVDIYISTMPQLKQKGEKRMATKATEMKQMQANTHTYIHFMSVLPTLLLPICANPSRSSTLRECANYLQWQDAIRPLPPLPMHHLPSAVGSSTKRHKNHDKTTTGHMHLYPLLLLTVIVTKREVRVSFDKKKGFDNHTTALARPWPPTPCIATQQSFLRSQITCIAITVK